MRLAVVWMALMAARAAQAVSFAAGQWNPTEWMEVRHGEWNRGSPIRQMADCVMNSNDDAWSDEDLYRNHQADVFSSLISTNVWTAPKSFVCELSFDHRMAPAIAIAWNIVRDAEGRPEFRDMYEIVLFEDGLNVWRHRRPEGSGKSVIDKVAFLKRKYLPKTKYALSVTLAEKKVYGGRLTREMTVTCGDDVLGFQDEQIPKAFQAGVIGSEGRCRFYSFEVK